MTQTVGTVAEIWRYPVKSMLGEKLGEAKLTTDGLEGDRRWALLDREKGYVLSAKKWAALLRLRATLKDNDAAGRGGKQIVVKMPDGSELAVGERDADQRISQYLGRPVSFARAQSEQRLRAEVDPATIFGDVPASVMVPGIASDAVPDSISLIKGGFCDAAPIHLVTTATLEFIRHQCGAETKVDTRRFRPNFLVATLKDLPGLCEDQWSNQRLRLGEEAELEIIRPSLRCVMTTHHQDDLPRDLRILRAIARANTGHLGVFASVAKAGRVRVGDSVVIIG